MPEKGGKEIIMSYIPDCRNDEYYNDKYLTGADKAFKDGYELACNDMKNFFDNLDIYTDDFDVEGVDINLVRFLENHKEALRVLKAAFDDWAEMQRNELITSLIDGMDEDEYEKIKAEVDSKEEGGKSND